MNENFVSRQQVNLLRERIRRAEETEATKELCNAIRIICKEKEYSKFNILVVGAGGSYPVALFAIHALRERYHTPNVEAVTPQTAVRMLTQFNSFVGCTWNKQYDVVIGISYSGRTPDIEYVSDICAERGIPFIILTGAEKSKIEDIYIESDILKIISYFNAEDTTGKEKGMISMMSTLAPIIILDDTESSDLIEENQDALIEGNKFVSDLNIFEIAEAIKQKPVVHVFYDWTTLPTATDIESKFIESGVANVILHEKKNFSHGRCTVLYNQPFALVINLTHYAIVIPNRENTKYYKNSYDKELVEFLTALCKEKSAHYLEIGTSAFEPAQWNIEAMTKIPYLITSIGEELGIDISKPMKPFPAEALPIYEYKGDF